MPKGKYKVDICSECKVRKKDSTQKPLYECQYCGRLFCADHFDPRLVVIRDLKRSIKDLRLRGIMEEEWEREDGHPDYNYTLKRLREFDVEKEMDRRTITALLDRSKRYKKRTFKKSTQQEVEETKWIQKHARHTRRSKHKKRNPHRKDKSKFRVSSPKEQKHHRKPQKFRFVKTKSRTLAFCNIIATLPLLIGVDIPFYIVMLVDALLIGLKLYHTITQNTRHWQAFSLRILGGVCELCGIILVLIGVISWGMLPNVLIRGGAIIVTLVGFALMLIGGALILRFKMKSGIIVYHGKA